MRRPQYEKHVSREAKGCLAATVSMAAVTFLPHRSRAVRLGSWPSIFLVTSGERLLCLSGWVRVRFRVRVRVRVRPRVRV